MERWNDDMRVHVYIEPCMCRCLRSNTCQEYSVLATKFKQKFGKPMALTGSADSIVIDSDACSDQSSPIKIVPGECSASQNSPVKIVPEQK